MSTAFWLSGARTSESGWVVGVVIVNLIEHNVKCWISSIKKDKCRFWLNTSSSSNLTTKCETLISVYFLTRRNIKRQLIGLLITITFALVDSNNFGSFSLAIKSCGFGVFVHRFSLFSLSKLIYWNIKTCCFLISDYETFWQNTYYTLKTFRSYRIIRGAFDTLSTPTRLITWTTIVIIQPLWAAKSSTVATLAFCITRTTRNRVNTDAGSLIFIIHTCVYIKMTWEFSISSQVYWRYQYVRKRPKQPCCIPCKFTHHLFELLKCSLHAGFCRVSLLV